MAKFSSRVLHQLTSLLFTKKFLERIFTPTAYTFLPPTVDPLLLVTIKDLLVTILVPRFPSIFLDLPQALFSLNICIQCLLSPQALQYLAISEHLHFGIFYFYPGMLKPSFYESTPYSYSFLYFFLIYTPVRLSLLFKVLIIFISCSKICNELIPFIE